MELITISEYVICPVCEEGKLMPISKSAHHTSRGENFWGEVVESSSSVVPIAHWQCSHCGHFTTKANNGRYRTGPYSFDASIDWCRTCECDHCRPMAKERYAKAEVERKAKSEKFHKKRRRRENAKLRLKKAKKKGFFK